MKNLGRLVQVVDDGREWWRSGCEGGVTEGKGVWVEQICVGEMVESGESETVSHCLKKSEMKTVSKQVQVNKPVFFMSCVIWTSIYVTTFMTIKILQRKWGIDTNTKTIERESKKIMYKRESSRKSCQKWLFKYHFSFFIVNWFWTQLKPNPNWI